METAAPATGQGGDELSREAAAESAQRPLRTDPDRDPVEGGSAATPGPLATDDPRVLTERARSQLLQLAQSGFSDTRTSAADVLETLAALTTSLDAEQQLRPAIAEIRFQAKRLRRTDSFVRAGWIARALNAALEGLERLECSQQLDSWLRAARRSVEVIDDRTTLSFQQASVQDAFRSTVDAFGAAIEPGTTCGTSSKLAGS